MKASSPRPRSYDVAILGGGPAGSATALALKRRDRQLRVALIEKTDYSALRVGETLPPPAQRLLMDLGVWDAFLERAPLESSGTRAAWGAPSFHDNAFIYSPYGRGWHVDRREFDAMLVGEAERAGVEVFRQTRYRRSMEGAGLGPAMLLEGAGFGPALSMDAAFVVDATGRRSSYARAHGARQVVFDQLVAVVMFVRFDAPGALPDSYTSIEPCEHGWWYAASLPKGTMAAILMTDAALLRRLPWRTREQWSSLLAAAPYTASRVAAGVPLGDPSVHAAASQRLDAFAGDGWLAVGDAASTFDPLSSQGIVKALRSAITASLAICQHLAGQSGALATFNARLGREYDHYLNQRATYYAGEQRWPDAPFWRCRHQSTVTRPGRNADALYVENQHQEEPEAARAGGV